MGGKHCASLSSASVSRADVSIDGVKGGPDQKNGYKGYAIYLEHSKLMPHFRFIINFLYISVCNILEIKIER